MLTKPLLLTILAACGAHHNIKSAESPTEEPDERQPPDTPQEDQHFCCTDVDPAKFTGDGCVAISGALETINACNNVLYCPGKWTKKDGNVTCE